MYVRTAIDYADSLTTMFGEKSGLGLALAPAVRGDGILVG